jgi:hypothetical protein
LDDEKRILAPHVSNSTFVEYNLIYTIFDTLTDPQVIPTTFSICPKYQELSFLIKIRKSTKNKKIIFEYSFNNDPCQKRKGNLKKLNKEVNLL